MRLENWFITNPDLEQQEILKTSIKENLVVKGPAGSGKTNMAIYRAKQTGNDNFIIIVKTVALSKMISYGLRELGLDKDRVAYDWSWKNRGLNVSGDLYCLAGTNSYGLTKEVLILDDGDKKRYFQLREKTHQSQKNNQKEEDQKQDTEDWFTITFDDWVDDKFYYTFGRCSNWYKEIQTLDFEEGNLVLIPAGNLYKKKGEINHIIIDEGQDFSLRDYRIFFSSNSLTSISVFGDSNQKIYNSNGANIESIAEHFDFKLLSLEANYRIPKTIAKVAQKIPNPHIDLLSNNRKNNGNSDAPYFPKPIIKKCNSLDDEFEYIYNKIKTLDLDDVAILLPNERWIEAIYEDLKANNIEAQVRFKRVIGKTPYGNTKYNRIDTLDFSNLDLPSLLTYNDSKGTEFENVFIPLAEEDNDDLTRNRLYVAITRSSKNLFITYSDKLTPFLSDVKKERCNLILIIMKRQNKMEYWIDLDAWSFNEIFTTESLSPKSFYAKRNFGNKIGRSDETIEEENNLILFNQPIEGEILLHIDEELLDKSFLKDSGQQGKLKSYEYAKTIYLKSDSFQVIFESEEDRSTFINNAFMLLEVKCVNKYLDNLVVDTHISKHKISDFQHQLFSTNEDKEAYFDKAYNHIKGLVYGYMIGKLGTLDNDKQDLVNSLKSFKNSVAGTHTSILLSEEYSDEWLYKLERQLNKCQGLYEQIFHKSSDVLETLGLRLKEIDKLNKERYEILKQPKSPFHQIGDEVLDKLKEELETYQGLAQLEKELAQIKDEERRRGEAKGKTREYYKESKDPEKYFRKKELNAKIKAIKDNPKYKELKQQIYDLENSAPDTCSIETGISDQFRRISDRLYDIIKRTEQYFLNKNNSVSIFPELDFKIDINKLTDYYASKAQKYQEFILELPETITKDLSQSEVDLLSISLNSLLSFPQGFLGDHSDEYMTQILMEIGKQIDEGEEKVALRDFYRYREHLTDRFDFTNGRMLQNLIVFLMKSNSYAQIKKMLINRKVKHQYIGLMLYGCYVGFANLPKTFTNAVFDSKNSELFLHIDENLEKITYR